MSCWWKIIVGYHTWLILLSIFYKVILTSGIFFYICCCVVVNCRNMLREAVSETMFRKKAYNPITSSNLKVHCNLTITLRKKCPYSEFFRSVFSSIQSEYGDLRSISPYSVQMRENKDQKNSEYGHFLRSVRLSS